MDIKKMLAATKAMRLRMVTEDTVESHLCACVKTRGGVAVKLMLLPGWPDRMVLLPGGIIIFVELKRPVGGRDEPMQPRVQRMLVRLGFPVFKLNTKEKVNNMLKEYR